MPYKDLEKRRARWREYYYRKIESNPNWNNERYNNSKLRRRNTRLNKKYNLESSQFDLMVESQQGVCAICKQPPKTTLVVDHCHKTGKVRGLLCYSCNTGLSWLERDGWLEQAQEYLH